MGSARSRPRCAPRQLTAGTNAVGEELSAAASRRGCDGRGGAGSGRGTVVGAGVAGAPAATVLAALRAARVTTVVVAPAPQPASASTPVALSRTVARRELKRSRGRSTGHHWAVVGGAASVLDKLGGELGTLEDRITRLVERDPFGEQVGTYPVGDAMDRIHAESHIRPSLAAPRCGPRRPGAPQAGRSVARRSLAAGEGSSNSTATLIPRLPRVARVSPRDEPSGCR